MTIIKSYYINCILISIELPVLAKVSTTPLINIINMNIETMGPSCWVPIFSFVIDFL